VVHQIAFHFIDVVTPFPVDPRMQYDRLQSKKSRPAENKPQAPFFPSSIMRKTRTTGNVSPSNSFPSTP
jgi:hypothetical protein